MSKVTFADLSGWLKAATVITFVIAGFYALAFLVGFIYGVTA